MKNAEKTACLDLRTVLQIGVAAWRETFFWPVSMDDYDRLFADLQAAYKQSIASCDDPEVQTVIVGSYWVPWEFSQVLIALKTVQCFREAGLRPIAGSPSDLYRPLLEGNLSLSPLGMKKWRLKDARWKRWLKGHINLLLSLKYNLPAGKIPWAARPNRKRRLLALYKPAPLCEEYIASLRGWVHLRLIATWFGQENGSPLPDALERKLDGLAEETAWRAIEIAKAHGIGVDGQIAAHLRGLAKSWFGQVAGDLSRVWDVLRREGPIDYLGVSGTNYYSRIASLTVRRLGGSVTAFSHGADTCRQMKDSSLSEFSACDNFVVETPGCIPLWEKVLHAYPPPLNNPVRLMAIPHERYLSVWKSYKVRPLPSRVRRVMVMGNCFQGDRYRGGKCPDLTRLDLELRVVDCLRKAGYEVLYKRHPEGVLRGRQIDFFPENVKVINEPFEAMMDQADAFLFLCTLTTTLGHAVCSNKPILFIHGGVEKWFAEPLERFAKRAHIVPGGFDERKRVVFDEESLLDALARAPSEPDEEFVRSYFLPDGAHQIQGGKPARGAFHAGR
ncbi:MAG: hypothetical protein ACE5JS_09825 [Nitrospinota bacterium]